MKLKTEKISLINRKTLESAQLDDWDSVAKLTAERQVIVESLFALELTAENHSNISELHKSIIDTDKTVKTLLNKSKNKTISLSVDLKNNQRALKQYKITRNHDHTS